MIGGIRYAKDSVMDVDEWEEFCLKELELDAHQRDKETHKRRRNEFQQLVANYERNAEARAQNLLTIDGTILQ